MALSEPRIAGWLPNLADPDVEISHPHTERMDSGSRQDSARYDPYCLSARSRLRPGEVTNPFTNKTTETKLQLQNHLLIKHIIESLPSHPIVVPLAPYISHGILHSRFLRPWTRMDLVDWMRNMCRKWEFWEDTQERCGETNGGISLLSHSNGSVAHGWSERSK